MTRHFMSAEELKKLKLKALGRPNCCQKVKHVELCCDLFQERISDGSDLFFMTCLTAGQCKSITKK